MRYQSGVFAVDHRWPPGRLDRSQLSQRNNFSSIGNDRYLFQVGDVVAITALIANLYCVTLTPFYCRRCVLATKCRFDDFVDTFDGHAIPCRFSAVDFKFDIRFAKDNVRADRVPINHWVLLDFCSDRFSSFGQSFK